MKNFSEEDNKHSKQQNKMTEPVSLNKCDIDRLGMSELNQSSCSVPMEPHRYIGDISEVYRR